MGREVIGDQLTVMYSKYDVSISQTPLRQSDFDTRDLRLVDDGLRGTWPDSQRATRSSLIRPLLDASYPELKSLHSPGA